MNTTGKTSLAVAAASVALLSACAGQNDAAAPSAPASAAVRSLTPSASSAPAAAQSSAAAPQVASGPVGCASADLDIALNPDQGGGGMNKTRFTLAFTNKGKAECTLQGSPGVSFVTGDDGVQVGAPATKEAEGGTAVPLAPGATATSTLSITNAGVFDPAECKPGDVRGLRVYPPGETAAVFVPHDQQACSAPDKSTMVVGQVVQG
ncbi:DUF4232 domain-containing protein [Umezawaea sp. Da 62-37]|uniref:DUF4232 domain-containing protein n=1 Tax=Umezawaea sp. Da 62-37 TaxID=3075927 RepID=UPI0028F6D8E7|nr:DUF4232 domain-containing protein [Umezawaea sp. Da 62-37]WNV85732.1 DUF4232 domain-containing protein [Umezawaea sp. Da 62-37]